MSATELAAMRHALALAQDPAAPHGPNPRVGCVILAADGTVVGEGWHRGAGSPHAEVVALRAAGTRAAGSTAVVTLEPCNHAGRTGPCTQALIGAGIARVVFAQTDPNPAASGGAAVLQAAGVDVVGGALAAESTAVNEAWTFAVTHCRPLVTWKVASTLDGRIAAADGTSRWVTGPAARAEVHALRAQVDAVLIGTGTALADDPSLTSRDALGQPGPRQPLRVVMGRRAIPSAAQLRDGIAPLQVFPAESPAEVLAALARREVRHVLLEAGPTLSGAFLRAGLVDRILWYLAPKLLGAGTPALGEIGVPSIDSARTIRITGIRTVGPDVAVEATVDPSQGAD